MNPTPPSSPKSALSRVLPPGQTKSSYSSAFVQVELFVFDPTLVTGFFHCPSSGDTTPTTEVVYDSQHLSIDDPQQALFFYLCRHTQPQQVTTTL